MAKQLPHVLMSDILCHLPVKSLLRFTSVSKSFCSEILSPEFIKRHYALSLQTNTNLSLLISSMGFNSLNNLVTPRKITSMDFDSLKNPKTFRNPLKRSVPMGTCNGLLCLSTPTGQIALFNSATRKKRLLPQLHHDFIDPILKELPNGAATLFYGFAYDQSKDDYNVVSITQIANLSTGRLLRNELMLYSLNVNAWNKVSSDHFPFTLTFDQKMGIYVCGKLHLDLAPISQLSYDLEDRNYMIVAFDPDFNNYTQVPLSHSLAKSKVCIKLCSLRGCLSVCSIRVCGGGCDSVWLMKEYGVEESWTKIMSFSRGLAGVWNPVAYSLRNDKVLFQASYSSFYWYDLTKKRIKKVKMSNSLPELSVGVVTVDSLVSLKSPGRMDANNMQSKKSQEVEEPKMDATNKRDNFMSWMKLTL